MHNMITRYPADASRDSQPSYAAKILMKMSGSRFATGLQSSEEARRQAMARAALSLVFGAGRMRGELLWDCLRT